MRQVRYVPTSVARSSTSLSWAAIASNVAAASPAGTRTPARTSRSSTRRPSAAMPSTMACTAPSSSVDAMPGKTLSSSHRGSSIAVATYVPLSADSDPASEARRSRARLGSRPGRAGAALAEGLVVVRALLRLELVEVAVLLVVLVRIGAQRHLVLVEGSHGVVCP